MKKIQQGNFQQLLADSESTLGKLAGKVNELQRINQYLQHILSPELKNKSHVANLRQGILVVATENANWITLLRFQQNDLLKKLQQKFKKLAIHQVHFIVIPKIPRRETVFSFEPTLSPESAKSIRDTAYSIDFEQLKEALLRLARERSSTTQS